MSHYFYIFHGKFAARSPVRFDLGKQHSFRMRYKSFIRHIKRKWGENAIFYLKKKKEKRRFFQPVKLSIRRIIARYKKN